MLAAQYQGSRTTTGQRRRRTCKPCIASRRVKLWAANTNTQIPTPTASPQIKAEINEQLNGTNRGIFGIPAAKKNVILDLIQRLETSTPVSNPTQQKHMLAGDWKLLFSTITITGAKRTKLGLREFVKLGEFVQHIDMESNVATNHITFSVSGLGTLTGSLTIKANFQPASGDRVNIMFQDALLAPPQLHKLFEQNYDLLLSIFNPEGYLDITYLDDKHRVGRDDKGNIFLLERLEKTNP